MVEEKDMQVYFCRYTNWDVENNGIRQIIKSLEQTPFITLMADGTTDMTKAMWKYFHKTSVGLKLQRFSPANASMSMVLQS